MIRKNRTLGSTMDRRVTIQKRSSTRDEYNEQTTWENVLTGVAAAMKEGGSSDEEGEKMNRVRASTEIEWTTRLITPRPQADWRLIDEYDSTIYDIIAPPTEVGRREGYKILTRLMQ